MKTAILYFVLMSGVGAGSNLVPSDPVRPVPVLAADEGIADNGIISFSVKGSESADRSGDEDNIGIPQSFCKMTDVLNGMYQIERSL
ncbi:MAG TPA: hypothetical protein PKY78_01410 [Candidatus Omnitrophota bacterium]|nr:hypothetical protein [Candidatus Omnitrophota bacterium]HPS19638.1 hypothetical protein [Candidatus Omnitrophota bacterium]